MSTARRISLNTFYQLVAKFINAISGFIIIGAITRQLGEEAVGIYTLTLTYVSLYFIAVDYGANAYSVKAIRSGTKHVFNKLLAQRLIISLIVVVFAAIILLALPEQGYTSEVKTGIFTILGVIIVQAILATSNAIFQEKENFFYQMLINLISASLNAILVLIMLSNGGSINHLFYAFLLASICGALTSLSFVKRYTKSLKLIYDSTFNKQLAAQTLPITISMITNLLYFRIDALIMPIFRNIAEIGHYNVAYRIFENALTIPTFLGNALYPTMLTLHQTDKFYQQMKKILVTSISIAILTSIILIILAPLLITIISGYPQQQTIDYLRILSAGLPFFFTTSLLMWVIITTGKQRALMWIYGINMLISIILNITLIPTYGAYASAWTTIALEAFVLILSIIALKVTK